jgi:hypothetical protein
MHVRGRGVARCAGMIHCHLALCPGEDQGRRQSRGSATDHHDVVLVHASVFFGMLHILLDSERCGSEPGTLHLGRGRPRAT